MTTVNFMPRHGTRPRYRQWGCRCIACTKRPHGTDQLPTSLRWPYKHLERSVGAEHLSMWIDEITIARWKKDGIDDYEADEVAIKFGKMAHEIFPGWTEAGLDANVYP